MSKCEDPRLFGFPTVMGPISEYETKVIPKLLNNAESCLGLNDSHLKTLQEFQDNFLRKELTKLLAACKYFSCLTKIYK